MRQKSQQTKWWERFSSWWLSGVRCVSPHGVFALSLLQLQYLIKLLDTLPFAQVLFSILLLPFHFCIPTDLPLWVDITLHKLCIDSAFIFKTLNCISYSVYSFMCMAYCKLKCYLFPPLLYCPHFAQTVYRVSTVYFCILYFMYLIWNCM